MKTQGTEAIKGFPLISGGLSRWKDIEHLIPFSRETYRIKAKQGTVPRPIRFGNRISLYKNDEIMDWLDNPQICKQTHR